MAPPLSKIINPCVTPFIFSNTKTKIQFPYFASLTFSSAFFTFGRIPRLVRLLPLDTDAKEPILRPDPLVGQR